MTTVATILDTFSEDCFGLEFDTHCSLRWDDDFNAVIPICDFLFVESAWEGRDKSWGGVFFGPFWKVFTDLCEICRKNSVPIVYWAKEDPVDYNRFLKIAKLADYVFTTASECVRMYKKDLGHDRVYTLPFAASSFLHYPSPEARLNKVAFAGTFWTGSHPGRKEFLEKMLDVAAEMDMLHIWDRNHGTPESDRPDRLFPERHRKFIQGFLPFSEMASAYRKYLAFFNVNIVSGSSTMFSRRVFEIMACGTPVITSHSPGIDNILGSAPITVRSKLEIRNVLENLQDYSLWEKISLSSVKAVLDGNTYSHRLKKILDVLGLEDLVLNERIENLKGVIPC